MTRILLHFTFLFMANFVQNFRNFFSKFEVQIRSSVVILPKLGRSSKFGRSKFSRWWSSPTKLPKCFHIFLSTLTIFQSLKFRFEVQSSSSPKLGRSVITDWTSNDPTWGWWRRLNFEKVRWPPNLEYDPQPKKIHQWYHNIWSHGIFRRSVFRRSNSVFSPIRRSGPFGVWSFGVRSFSVGSLFGVWVLFGVWSFSVRSFGVRSFGVRSFDVRSFGVPSFGVQ